MKKLCIILAVVLLSSAMLADALRPRGSNTGLLKCGGEVCDEDEQCDEVPVQCFKPPCEKAPTCVRKRRG
ncbi:hypothetical protein MTO96_051840 [Rhipicephalus appendiculatus]